MDPSEAKARVEEAVEFVKRHKIVAILRAANPEAAVARALELAELGCRLIEITLDTTDFEKVVRELSEKLPSSCMLGVGTVMEADKVNELVAMGLNFRFCLSPINPEGFVARCHANGIMAVPAAFTSNEMWKAHHTEGARMIKLFHASLIPPATLKGMLGVGPLGAMNIMPSGGIDADAAPAWLAAGAASLGMGSKFAGKDIQLVEGDPGLEAAKQEWAQNGRGAVKRLMDSLKTQ
ncbi:KHG/KDPG aldolase-like [Sycon ciliatum]|uniref:KHG/KDPG aldolase-like n=1 Tax=Sycon ciliatum TaxID=27933 RepID=UPI0020AB28A8|eukprot:scpid75411/ scgid6882/ 